MHLVGETARDPGCRETERTTDMKKAVVVIGIGAALSIVAALVIRNGDSVHTG